MVAIRPECSNSDRCVRERDAISAAHSGIALHNRAPAQSRGIADLLAQLRAFIVRWHGCCTAQ
jgi:hypothetical protein